ncbi:GAF domain-containing sensor histidine kinase [Alicyclobacillus herbarius]|uniref:GAF domain-containing sensor histidine kinase n=1 Tax=Alicyclobacillus herbarius TaxID=122960 RepID=UPI000424E55A|nr:GAF domain-containing protein [Alicyclobacillus herbarius]
MSRATTNQAEVLRILSEALERLQPWMEEGLEPLLQAVVDHARTLVNAAFAGIIITEPKDPFTIRYFKVSGWDTMPMELPKGHGMYFIPAKTGDSLHVESISGHPLSVGMPKGHPPVEALLTIPLKYHGQAIGCIFFGKPPKTSPFTKTDEDMMNGFASLCSIFISWCDQQNENCFRILTEERRRIAEELHDSLSQTLFAVAREIDRLERLTVEEHSELQARTTRLRELTEQCQSELRAILFRLMDDEARPNATALTHLVQEFERISGISTKLITHGNFGRLSLPIRQTMLKVVAESLTNIFRHANSPVAIVHLLVETDEATLTVQDAGIGISGEALRLITHPTGHFGLHSMARSVAILNGQLDIFRNEDGGTTVRCTFPIRYDSTSEAKI